MPQPSEALLRVAEACDIGCEFIRNAMWRCCGGESECKYCARRREESARLESHAAAIRAGRVTITEEGPNGPEHT